MRLHLGSSSLSFLKYNNNTNLCNLMEQQNSRFLGRFSFLCHSGQNSVYVSCCRQLFCQRTLGLQQQDQRLSRDIYILIQWTELCLCILLQVAVLPAHSGPPAIGSETKERNSYINSGQKNDHCRGQKQEKAAVKIRKKVKLNKYFYSEKDLILKKC